MNISSLLTQKLDRRPLALIKRAGMLADSLGMRAYLVGGMVRDILMGLKPGRDIDITVEGDGMAFAGKLAGKLKAAYKTFDKFGTGKVFLSDGYRIDTASARTEIYAGPAALPDVRFSGIEKDLFRRDFTINAMAAGINKKQFGELLDPYGGREAIKERELRVLHDGSFIDDPTRILRFIRFQSRFGYKADNGTLKLFCSALQGNIFDAVSGERLREELVLALSEKDPVKTFENLQKSRVLEKLTPGIVYGRLTGGMFERIGSALKEIKARGVDPVLLKLMAFLCFSPPAAATGSLARLKFSNDRREHVLQAGKALGEIDRLAKGKLKKSAVYSLLKGYDIAVLLFLKIVPANLLVKRNITGYISAVSRQKIKITGKDLKKMGIKEGPIYGKILDGIMAARLDGKVKTKKEEIEFAKTHIK